MGVSTGGGGADAQSGAALPGERTSDSPAVGGGGGMMGGSAMGEGMQGGTGMGGEGMQGGTGMGGGMMGGPAMGGGMMGGPATGEGDADSTVGEGGSISGTVTIASGLEGKIPVGATLYISARMSGGESGMPLASARLVPESFPVSFTLSQANVLMAGMPFHGTVTLSARLDWDGNATTRQEGDVQGVLSEPVQVGAQDVTIELNQIQ